MAIKLTDAQRAMLSAAAQREDRCLTPLKTARGAQLAKIGKTLISAGLVREVKAKPSSPIWRRDVESQATYALKLTAAGAKAISVEVDRAGDGEADSETDPPLVPAESESAAAMEKGDGIARGPATASAQGRPRANSKIAGVITQLMQPDGATLAELVAATGWLPHTTRAALTGLRKRGYGVAIDRSDRTRGSVYRIASTAPRGEGAPSAGVAEAA